MISPLQRLAFPNCSRRAWVKRDDLRSLKGCLSVCGNKSRKLTGLLRARWENVALISHGGNQSNSMNALSALAESQGVPFLYLTPRAVRGSPTEQVGNWSCSLSRGMVPWVLETRYQTLFPSPFLSAQSSHPSPPPPTITSL